MIDTKQCSKCKQIYPTTFFYKRSDAKSGLTSHCKDCQRAYKKKWRKENYIPRERKPAFALHRKIINGVEHKKCTACEKYLILTEFWSNKKSKDGYYWRCKTCMREYNRKHKLRNPTGHKKDKRRYRDRLRLKVYKILSQKEVPECQICGFTDDIRLLHIDHVNNDGCKERREDKEKRGYHNTDTLKRRILDMSPEDARKKYRILCVLHNWTDRLGFVGNEYSVIKI